MRHEWRIKEISTGFLVSYPSLRDTVPPVIIDEAAYDDLDSVLNFIHASYRTLRKPSERKLSKDQSDAARKRI